MSSLRDATLQGSCQEGQAAEHRDSMLLLRPSLFILRECLTLNYYLVSELCCRIFIPVCTQADCTRPSAQSADEPSANAPAFRTVYLYCRREYAEFTRQNRYGGVAVERCNSALQALGSPQLDHYSAFQTRLTRWRHGSASAGRSLGPCGRARGRGPGGRIWTLGGRSPRRSSSRCPAG